MKFNYVTPKVQLVGTSIKNLEISNSIIDIQNEEERSFGFNINDARIVANDETLIGTLDIDFELKIVKEDAECTMDMTVEGAFLAEEQMEIDDFEEFIMINGAAALIGIARGKIESISASIFNEGKIVIPFVNVIDYYKKIMEK